MIRASLVVRRTGLRSGLGGERDERGRVADPSAEIGPLRLVTPKKNEKRTVKDETAGRDLINAPSGGQQRSTLHFRSSLVHTEGHELLRFPDLDRFIDSWVRPPAGKS